MRCVSNTHPLPEIELFSESCSTNTLARLFAWAFRLAKRAS